MATTYDAIIIGTGQAGPSLAVRLAGAGMKVAIIERKRFGGTCVNNGCIPTKTLVASAHAAYIARRAGDYGVVIESSIAVDMRKVKERKDAVVRGSNEGLTKWLKSTENLTVYEGHARFEAPHRVRIGDELLKGDKIFINVGGRASTPPARPRPGELLEQLNDDGRGLSARASDRRRRQLCRFGVCSDVPPVRQCGDYRRDGASADSA
jgi:pyruvate/2-oxoglutarate dehydrogenase complex dihydrolipoamide dehydrogenase (E3) component